MEADTRRTLSMAHRALDFAAVHPATDASYTALVARLQERVNRADTLAIQQRDGRTGEKAAIAHRETLKKSLQRVQLRHLVSVAELAIKEQPELFGLFTFPDAQGPHRTFVTAAKSMLAAAGPYKELFLSLGLGDTFLEELTQAVADFDKATDDAHSGRRDHVGARAELLVVARECVKLVKVLDGLYRIRFRNDAEALAAWTSAKNVPGPFGKAKGAAAAPEGDAAPAPLPASSAVIPATVAAG